MKNRLLHLILGTSLTCGGAISYAGDSTPLPYADGACNHIHEALEYFRCGAEWGDAGMQFNLGLLYHRGLKGATKDYQEALKWYMNAAEQGDMSATYNIGFMHKKGQGVPQDYGQAVKWFRKAAEEGDSDAQYSLADLYFGGHGVQRDYIYAHMWLNIAAANGDEDAVEFRDQLSARMTQDQIAEAHQLARECLKRDHKDC